MEIRLNHLIMEHQKSIYRYNDKNQLTSNIILDKNLLCCDSIGEFSLLYVEDEIVFSKLEKFLVMRRKYHFKKNNCR